MIRRFIRVLESANEGVFESDPGAGVLTGFSGKKLMAALHGLLGIFASEDEICYLEVGVFQGMTLLSTAASCPDIPCFGIDNFAFFDPKKENLGLIERRAAQLGVQNYSLINMDYEDALEELSEHIGARKVAVYFVDGPHDYRSQLMCLELALPYLHEQAVVVVDDSNYRHVRQANHDFLVTHPEWKLLSQAYTESHPLNMVKEGELAARDGWWNGVNVLVRDPGDELPSKYPPTERSRKLYEYEHVLFSSKAADIVPESYNVVRALYHLDVPRLGVYSLRFLRAAGRHKRENKNLFKEMNTFSAGLPAFECLSQHSDDTWQPPIAPPPK